MTASILLVFGTRPEAIKLAPLYFALREAPGFAVTACVTGQHRELLDPVLEFFAIEPDFDLAIMRPDQTLFDVTADGLKALRPVMERVRPDAVAVQGDTTSAFVGALAAYYEKVPSLHVEAGLRSGDRYAPFPEEMNRVLVGHLCHWHFAPTETARRNLAREGLTENVHVVGNTVIDALLLARTLIRARDAEFRRRYAAIDPDRTLILVTGHRRESFGAPFREMLAGLRDIAERFSDRVSLVYPVHLNPRVKGPVHKMLSGLPNFHLLDPVPYPDFVWLLERCAFVITDSGGVQEEAPALGKPVLVTRRVTERTEAIETGNARLVGTDRAAILREASRLLRDPDAYAAASQSASPFGDGTAAQRIVRILAADLAADGGGRD